MQQQKRNNTAKKRGREKGCKKKGKEKHSGGWRKK
jgi:hypothetical protein